MNHPLRISWIQDSIPNPEDFLFSQTPALTLVLFKLTLKTQPAPSISSSSDLAPRTGAPLVIWPGPFCHRNSTALHTDPSTFAVSSYPLLLSLLFLSNHATVTYAKAQNYLISLFFHDTCPVNSQPLKKQLFAFSVFIPEQDRMRTCMCIWAIYI